ncbi:hypothetical protein, partial [Priestia megaterium]|uniref:hypothetical protein n=1 Tax=Priestia megaterium TaxID=1404 RepID=UPI003A7FB222
SGITYNFEMNHLITSLTQLLSNVKKAHILLFVPKLVPFGTILFFRATKFFYKTLELERALGIILRNILRIERVDQTC